jgi:hypothetical protein
VTTPLARKKKKKKKHHRNMEGRSGGEGDEWYPNIGHIHDNNDNKSLDIGGLANVTIVTMITTMIIMNKVATMYFLATNKNRQ